MDDIVENKGNESKEGNSSSMYLMDMAKPKKKKKSLEHCSNFLGNVTPFGLGNLPLVGSRIVCQQKRWVGGIRKESRFDMSL